VRIWVDFYATTTTEHVVASFMENIRHLQHHIVKLAVVGVSFSVKQRIGKFVKRSTESRFPVRFFTDPEEAKTWLVKGT
jgi:hypothetical protein